MHLHVSSTMCSSSGGQNCIIQHLVSSPLTCFSVMIPYAVKYESDLLMMSTQCSEHVETYNKLVIKHFVH